MMNRSGKLLNNRRLRRFLPETSHTVRERPGGRPRRFGGVAGNISAGQVLLAGNLALITGLLFFMILRPPTVNVAAVNTLPVQTGPAETEDTPPTDEADTNTAEDKQQPEQPEPAAPEEEPASWKLAQQLYKAGDWPQAYTVFGRLHDSLMGNIPGNDVLKDYLKLKMALCLTDADDKGERGRLFTAALGSRSPLVRALANYRLAFIESHNRQFLDARSRAYRALALIKAFEKGFSATLEADCYFMAADALTRAVLVANNASHVLPGQRWADTLEIKTIPLMEQSQLRAFLETGADFLAEGAIYPKIGKDNHLSAGLRWSAVSLDCPLEEVVSRVASAAGLKLRWQDMQEDIRFKPTTLCLTGCSEQFLCEVAVGGTGLIARMDGERVVICDPRLYKDLDEYKQLLTHEAIAVWRRFLLRYRTDDRGPNAHYALGLLLNYAGEPATALGEYKLVAGRYSNDPLAPFALLNASVIKTNLRDYTGAQRDLKDLILQYPDCKVAGQASLYLADTTMKTGLFDEAIKMYKRVYNLDTDKAAKRNSAYGLGRCFFQIENYDEAARWFATAIELTDNTADQRLSNSYYLLGKSYIALNRYRRASAALLHALDNSATQEEFFDIIMDLVASEVSQEHYVNALNILENIPTDRLSQEEMSTVLIATSKILRQIDLVESATTLVRRRIQFVADSRIRAGVTEALAELAPGELKEEAYLLLAKISLDLKDFRGAQDACLSLLNLQTGDKAIRDEALALLGRTYADMGLHEQAALAYAGVFAKTGGISK